MRFAVSPEKNKALVKAMQDAGIEEKDLQESFVLSRGPGGQKIQKTSVAVELLHTPSGFRVKVDASRSQSVNRYKARVLLVEKIQAEVSGKPTRKESRSEKIKKQKKRRARRAREE